MNIQALSSNWKRLQAAGKTGPESTTTGPQGLKRKRVNDKLSASRLIWAKKPRRSEPMLQAAKVNKSLVDDQVNAGLSPSTELGRYIAIDCEMVGVGPNPAKSSALARVSVVNFNGEQVYDSYVLAKEEVTDYRTPVSGIMAKHMLHARPLEEVQEEIAKILQDRVLVGHAVGNDLHALMLGHPKRDIRDTSKHPPHRQLAGGGSPRLKILAEHFLGLEIQTGEHSSIEDARACMLLYQRDKDAFERDHARKWPARPVRNESSEVIKARPQKKKNKAKR